MVSSRKGLGQKTLKKYIARWRDSNYRDAFQYWKTYKN